MMKRILLGVILTAVLATGAQAAIYVQDFTGADGSQPSPDWTTWVSGDPAPAIDSNQYFLDGPPPGGAYPHVLAGYSGDTSLADVTVSSDVQVSRNTGTANMTPTSGGVIARYQAASSGHYAAYLGYRVAGQSGWAFCLANVGTNYEYPSFLATELLTNVAWGDWVNVSLDAAGSSLTAVLKNAGGDTLSTLNVTDSTYSSGACGIYGATRNRENQNPAYGHTMVRWDNLEVVPEPATMSLLALGGAGLLIRRKR